MKPQGNLNQRFLLAAALLVVGGIGWLLYISAPDPSVWRITGYVVGLLFTIAGIEWVILNLFRMGKPGTEPQVGTQNSLMQGFRFALVFLIVGVAGWTLYVSAPFLSLGRTVGLALGGAFTIGGLLVLGIYTVRTVQARK